MFCFFPGHHRNRIALDTAAAATLRPGRSRVPAEEAAGREGALCCSSGPAAPREGSGSQGLLRARPGLDPFLLQPATSPRRPARVCTATRATGLEAPTFSGRAGRPPFASPAHPV